MLTLTVTIRRNFVEHSCCVANSRRMLTLTVTIRRNLPIDGCPKNGGARPWRHWSARAWRAAGEGVTGG
jgi:hypothetical protein